MKAVAAALCVLGGLGGSVQVAVMGRFGSRIGTLQALAFASVLSMTLSLALLLAVRQSLGGLRTAASAPPWLWAGAPLSVLVVFAVTLSAPRIGTFATVGIFVAGQLAMGVVIDRFGLFGLERIPLNWPRVLGVLLLGAGAALVLRK
jgi:transporter family-2 protein